jgi:hypothetical protein
MFHAGDEHAIDRTRAQMHSAPGCSDCAGLSCIFNRSLRAQHGRQRYGGQGSQDQAGGNHSIVLFSGNKGLIGSKVYHGLYSQGKLQRSLCLR